MADVKLTWTANDPSEGVSEYHIFQDTVEVGTSVVPEFTIPNVTPGVHTYEVAAQNLWGLGPKSDPVTTPAAASKVGGVSFSIVVNITTNITQ